MNGLVQFVNAALVNCVNLLTYELHFTIARWFYISTWFYCLEDLYIYIYYMRMIAYLHMCLLVCMHVCTLVFMHEYSVYACMYMCISMFLILICVCMLSSFHPHNHLSPNIPRLMFLFVDCATVNMSYLILSISSYLILNLPNKYFLTAL